MADRGRQIRDVRDEMLERGSEMRERLTRKRLFGLDRSGPDPPQTRAGQPLLQPSPKPFIQPQALHGVTGLLPSCIGWHAPCP